MAYACPIDLDRARLREEVRRLYHRVALEPEGDFHFHRGASFAVERLSYDPRVLSELPAEVTDSFAGVGNPHVIAPLTTGQTVVDIGSGTGTDLLVAAQAVGPTGKVIGVDFTASMRDRARKAAEGLPQVSVLEGDVMALPLPDASVDVVISNGVLNLAPDKEVAFGEIARVLKPTGRLQFADIVVASELSEGIRSDIDLWAA
ncbi:MAG: methyltransferase domain-containing protein [Myxococcota bacterium]